MTRAGRETPREEVLFKVVQAFKLCPRLTASMLQSFLTSRVSNEQRERALKTLLDTKSIQRQTVEISSYRGRSSRVTLLVWVGVNVGEVRDGGINPGTREGTRHSTNSR